ncbi:MAG TPA: hypothetical protein VIH75_09450 [Candidatus Sulfotelmatobacter sp.]
MTQKCFCCGVVIVALTIGLVVPARAVDAEGGLIIVAATMAAAAIAVIVVASVPHRSKKIVITGCVLSGEKGMTITDQEDSKVYLLSGETTGIRPGDRMKLRGRRVRSTASDKTGLWEAKEVLKDFGVCQP